MRTTAVTAPTAEVDVIPIDDATDNRVPNEAGRILRNALDAVQAQNQPVSATFDGPVLTAAQVRNIRAEAARRFHMLRELEGDRLEGRMTPEGYNNFLLVTAIPIETEKMERISAQQRIRMERMLKDIPWMSSLTPSW